MSDIKWRKTCSLYYIPYFLSVIIQRRNSASACDWAVIYITPSGSFRIPVGFFISVGTLQVVRGSWTSNVGVETRDIEAEGKVIDGFKG